MNKRAPSGAASPKDAAPPAPCKAEFIFYAQAQRDRSKPAKVLGDYVCDFTRADWEHRWKEWNSRLNPYLHLFLCATLEGAWFERIHRSQRLARLHRFPSS